MVRLGQNFLADPNLLDAVVRDAGLGPGDVALEVGTGEGVLTERLADAAARVHTIELDRRLEGALAPLAAPAISPATARAPSVDLMLVAILIIASHCVLDTAAPCRCQTPTCATPPRTPRFPS